MDYSDEIEEEDGFDNLDSNKNNNLSLDNSYGVFNIFILILENFEKTSKT